MAITAESSMLLVFSLILVNSVHVCTTNIIKDVVIDNLVKSHSVSFHLDNISTVNHSILLFEKSMYNIFTFAVQALSSSITSIF